MGAARGRHPPPPRLAGRGLACRPWRARGSRRSSSRPRRSRCRLRRPTRSRRRRRSRSRPGSATTASRSWSGPTRSARTSRRCDKLSDYHGIAVLAVHSPCLIVTQRVWGTDPDGPSWCGRSRLPRQLGAETVVVHPPFRWQREYVQATFVAGIHRMAVRDRRYGSRSRTCSRCGLAGGRSTPYSPDYDPSSRRTTPSLHPRPVPHVGVDTNDAMRSYMVPREIGSTGLAHIHICGRADGTARVTSTSCPGRGDAAVRAAARGPGRPRGFDGTDRRGDQHPVAPRVAGRARGRPRRGARLHPAQPRSARSTARCCAAPDGDHIRACLAVMSGLPAVHLYGLRSRS